MLMWKHWCWTTNKHVMLNHKLQNADCITNSIRTPHVQHCLISNSNLIFSSVFDIFFSSVYIFADSIGKFFAPKWWIEKCEWYLNRLVLYMLFTFFSSNFQDILFITFFLSYGLNSWRNHVHSIVSSLSRWIHFFGYLWVSGLVRFFCTYGSFFALILCSHLWYDSMSFFCYFKLILWHRYGYPANL